MSKQPEFFKDGKYVGYPRVESAQITDDVREEVTTAREKSYQEEGGDLRKLYKAGLASRWRETATLAESEAYREQVEIEKKRLTNTYRPMLSSLCDKSLILTRNELRLNVA